MTSHSTIFLALQHNKLMTGMDTSHDLFLIVIIPCFLVKKQIFNILTIKMAQNTYSSRDILL